MRISDLKKRDVNESEISKQETSKIKELADSMKSEIEENKNMTSSEARKAASERLEKRKPFSQNEAERNSQLKRPTENIKVEDKLNKKQDISFGTSGCEAFCKKVHDGTRVHGTY